ncbi:Peptidyl-prolyl cis-trans isomerase CYP37 chloroplastic [Bienertia sinuspersici]
MQESTDHHGSPYSSCLTIGKHGLKRLERALTSVLIVVQISTPLLVIDWDSYFVPPANAVLYSPDTKVPRTGELALRRAIPANPNMKAIQESLEDISYLLRIPQRNHMEPWREM